jgi:hypothetical protein
MKREARITRGDNNIYIYDYSKVLDAALGQMVLMGLLLNCFGVSRTGDKR